MKRVVRIVSVAIAGGRGSTKVSLISVNDFLEAGWSVVILFEPFKRLFEVQAYYILLSHLPLKSVKRQGYEASSAGLSR